MATKLFIHPAGGYLLETSSQNYRFNDLGAIRTDETGEAMEQTSADITTQATINNALAVHNEALSGGEIEVLASFIEHMVESFE
jgi:hypothetical protein